MTDPKIEELFGLNTAKSEVNNKISLMANMMKASMDPMTLGHSVSHIRDKLKDPSEKGCTKSINDLLNYIWAELTLEEIPLLIDAVEPVEGFLEAPNTIGDIDGVQMQSSKGALEDFIRFIMRDYLGGMH